MVWHGFSLGVENRVEYKMLNPSRPGGGNNYLADSLLVWAHVWTDVVEPLDSLGGPIQRGLGTHIANHSLTCAQGLNDLNLFGPVYQRSNLLSPDD